MLVIWPSKVRILSLQILRILMVGKVKKWSRFWYVEVSQQPRKIRGVTKLGALLSLVSPSGLG